MLLLEPRITVEHFCNVPNVLSFLRIILTPVLVYVFFNTSVALAGIFFTLIAMTDLLDGYYARRYGIKTTLGAFLDPIADKILISTTLFLFVYVGVISWRPIFLIVFRDVLITGLRLKLIYNRTSLVTSDLGKSKTFIQFLTIGCMFTALFMKQFFTLEQYDIVLVCIACMMWVVALMTCYSGVDYLIKYFKRTRI